MSATITINPDGTATVTLAYTAPQQKILDVANDAARQGYEEGIRAVVDPGTIITPYDDLTVEERLQVLSLLVREFVVLMAKRGYVNQAVRDATILANEEAQDKYI